MKLELEWLYLNIFQLDLIKVFSFKDKRRVTYFQTSFTRDEIEEFGIEHPEVRREYLEFIEVVSE